MPVCNVCNVWLAVRLVTMAIQWSLATLAGHVSVMVTVLTLKAESCVIVVRVSVCRALTTPRGRTVSAADLGITAPR